VRGAINPSTLSGPATPGEAGMIGTKTTSCVMDEEFIKTLPGTPWPAVSNDGTAWNTYSYIYNAVPPSGRVQAHYDSGTATQTVALSRSTPTTSTMSTSPSATRQRRQLASAQHVCLLNTTTDYEPASALEQTRAK
jgi:hypothetical protein